MKLLLNLERAKQIVILEGKKILRHYNNIAFYLNHIANGGIVQLRKMNKKRKFKTIM